MIANIMIPRRREDCDDCKYDDTKKKRGLDDCKYAMIPRRREDWYHDIYNSLSLLFYLDAILPVLASPWYHHICNHLSPR